MTLIEWTDKTDNPIIVKGGGHWCRKISPGCANCYAERINNNSRFHFASKLKYEGREPDLELKWEILEGWKRARKPAKHFVSSMTDIFGEWVPQEWIFEMLDAMAASPNQTFQLLTKRPDMMLFHVRLWLFERRLQMLPENIWVGCTTENHTTAKNRIPVLLEVPAAIRFISCEPLLEAISSNATGFEELDWIIVGGESGPGARPCHQEWIESLILSTTSVNIPIFVKQLGSNFVSQGKRFKTGHPDGKNWDKWPERLRIREFPQC